MRRSKTVGIGLFCLALGGLPAATAQDGAASEGAALLSAGLLGQEGPVDLSSFITETAFSGYVDIGWTYNLDNNVTTAGANGENRFRVFDTRHNEFALHSASLDMNKEANADSVIGYHVTAIVGDDASAVNATSPTAGDVFRGDVGDVNAGEDFSLTNAYISGFVPFLEGLEVRVGRFETTIGAEVIHNSAGFTEIGNANYSRSYLFGFSGPFTHTGVLLKQALVASQDGSTLLAAHVGWTNGWDNINDNNNSGTMLAGVSVDPVPWFGVAFNSAFGPEQTQGTGLRANSDYRTLLELLTKFKLPTAVTDGSGMDFLDGLGLLVDFQWAGEEGVPGVDGPGRPGYAQWWGVSGILRYDFALPILGGDGEADNFFLAFRGEYFDDHNGVRGISTGAGTRADIYALTWTLGWKPASMLLIRGEVRFDKADYDAFQDGRRSRQVTFGVNAVVSF